MHMIMFGLFTWWYGQGWALLMKNVQRRLVLTMHIFSVPILLRTMFAPWRRIMTYPGASLGDHFRASLDNLISRMVGFVVRILALIAAMIVVVFVGIIGVLEIIAWPLLPMAIVGALIEAVVR
jgi:hypothetical protein